MACCGLGGKEKSFVDGVCKVCEENQNDSRVKKVFWCETCKAYICANHRNDVLARAKAAAKVSGKKVINFIKRF